jgi:hypothetical protein
MTVRILKPEVNIREKLTELEGKQDKPPYIPAFSCAGGGSYTTTTGDQNIAAFCAGSNNSGVLFDIGGNLTNGAFKAPFAGLYKFSLKMQVNYSSGYFFSYIYKNSSNIPNHSCQFYQSNNVCTLDLLWPADEGDVFEPYITNNYTITNAISSPVWNGYYIGPTS